MTYNLLNLPQLVHMKGEGSVICTYDAAGNKLERVIDRTAGTYNSPSQTLKQIRGIMILSLPMTNYLIIILKLNCQINLHPMVLSLVTSQVLIFPIP